MNNMITTKDLNACTYLSHQYFSKNSGCKIKTETRLTYE